MSHRAKKRVKVRRKVNIRLLDSMFPPEWLAQVKKTIQFLIQSNGVLTMNKKSNLKNASNRGEMVSKHAYPCNRFTNEYRVSILKIAIFFPRSLIHMLIPFVWGITSHYISNRKGVRDFYIEPFLAIFPNFKGLYFRNGLSDRIETKKLIHF